MRYLDDGLVRYLWGFGVNLKFKMFRSVFCCATITGIVNSLQFVEGPSDLPQTEIGSGAEAASLIDEKSEPGEDSKKQCEDVGAGKKAYAPGKGSRDLC